MHFCQILYSWERHEGLELSSLSNDGCLPVQYHRERSLQSFLSTTMTLKRINQHAAAPCVLHKGAAWVNVYHLFGCMLLPTPCFSACLRVSFAHLHKARFGASTRLSFASHTSSLISNLDLLTALGSLLSLIDLQASSSPRPRGACSCLQPAWKHVSPLCILLLST